VIRIDTYAKTASKCLDLLMKGVSHCSARVGRGGFRRFVTIG
jgi:hypothetical protein